MSRLFCLMLLTGALTACKERASDIDPSDDVLDTGSDPNSDTDSDTDETDVPRYEDGTEAHPYLIPVVDNVANYTDSRSTTDALSDSYDLYGDNPQDESGPENLYVFEVTERAIVRARLAFPEPEGVDNDLHLLADFDPDAVISRHHHTVTETIEPGEYVLSVDTYVSSGVEMSGPYELFVDIVPWYDGTLDDPIPVGAPVGEVSTLPIRFTDTRDTSEIETREIDVYPPSKANESGPEVVYWFEIDEEARITVDLIAPEPDGVDIDVHLLDGVEPVSLVERGDGQLHTVIGPGEYWIVADTYVGVGGEMSGAYTMNVHVRSTNYNPEDFFNKYVLKSVDYLYENYGLLGYDSAVLTHDIEYGDYGLIEATMGTMTMCVGGMLEVILVAMELYEADTGDSSVWDFLPERSWERLGAGDLKAHLWVNYDLHSGGSADALRHFGMGENIGFKDLMPGSFINFNRETGTGHAVVFISYIDISGSESEFWHEDVVGFKYFSAQNGGVGVGGLDYRYAVFAEYGKPDMPYKRDTRILYREENDQRYLNTGMMYHPTVWRKTDFSADRVALPTEWLEDVSAFDPEYFDGVALESP